jgi:hypothetical protein
MRNLSQLTRRAVSDVLGVHGNIIALVRNEETGFLRVYQTHNIVTDAGDIYYAQSAAGEAVTNAFDTLWLGDGGSAPAKGNDSDDITLIASSAKLVKATYPLTDDGDADNTGAAADVLTWTFEYAAGDFNHAAITDGMIGVGAHGAAEPALTHFEFSGGAFEKTASDTLKVIVNHTFNGV